jgi:hypothetical protein
MFISDDNHHFTSQFYKIELDQIQKSMIVLERLPGSIGPLTKELMMHDAVFARAQYQSMWGVQEAHHTKSKKMRREMGSAIL